MPNEIKATPRKNPLLGAIADALKAADDYAQREDSTMPMDKANPLLSLLSDYSGFAGLGRTLDRISYGEPLTTGAGWNTRIRDDTIDAAGLALPAIASGTKLAGKGANKLADVAVQKITGNSAATAPQVLDYARRMVPANPITVWQGSPHKFDPEKLVRLPDGREVYVGGRFNALKEVPDGATVIKDFPLGRIRISEAMGTGEGAQAYGHGAYLAEAKDVGEGYQHKLSGSIPTEISTDAGPIGFREAAAIAWGEDAANALIASNSHMKNEAWVAVADALRSKGINNAKPISGNLYSVDLPDEMVARMLDWDKPLSEQPASVRIALTSIAKNDENVMRQFKELGPSAKADIAYAALTQNAVRAKKYAAMRDGIEEAAATPSLQFGQNEASLLLRGHGIPGIRYLDGGSRGVGAGTSNFVVFPGEENRLTILTRNGQPK